MIFRGFQKFIRIWQGRFSEIFRGFQTFSEVFINLLGFGKEDFQRFSEVFRVFQRFSEIGFC